jgi:hypothetical protein
MYILRRAALRKGVLGGNKSWMVLFVFLSTPTLMRKVFGRTEVLLAREKLLPGQFVRVQALGDLPKAERKAVLKAK